MSAGVRRAVVGLGNAPLEGGKSVTPGTPVGTQAKVALADAGLTDLDRLLTAGGWGIPGLGQFQTASLPGYLGIDRKFADGTDGGDSAVQVHVGHAVTAVEAGRYDVALISYRSTQRSGARWVVGRGR